jgi:hypothetical protein
MRHYYNISTVHSLFGNTLYIYSFKQCEFSFVILFYNEVTTLLLQYTDIQLLIKNYYN